MVKEYERHEKKSNFDLSKNHEYTYFKESKFSNLLYHYNIMTLSKSCSKNKLLLASC